MLFLIVAGRRESTRILSAKERASDKSWVIKMAEIPEALIILPISAETISRVW